MKSLNINISDLFKKRKQLSQGPVRAFIPHTGAIWRSSVAFLTLLLLVTLLFDGYLFWFRVLTIEQQVIFDENDQTLPGLDKTLLKSAQEQISIRKARFESAKDNVIRNNPFQKKAELVETGKNQ